MLQHLVENVITILIGRKSFYFLSILISSKYLHNSITDIQENTAPKILLVQSLLYISFFHTDTYIYLLVHAREMLDWSTTEKVQKAIATTQPSDPLSRTTSIHFLKLAFAHVRFIPLQSSNETSRTAEVKQWESGGKPLKKQCHAWAYLMAYKQKKKPGWSRWQLLEIGKLPKLQRC